MSSHDTESKVCPECTCEVPVQSIFCPECGKYIIGERRVHNLEYTWPKSEPSIGYAAMPTTYLSSGGHGFIACASCRKVSLATMRAYARVMREKSGQMAIYCPNCGMPIQDETFHDDPLGLRIEIMAHAQYLLHAQQSVPFGYEGIRSRMSGSAGRQITHSELDTILTVAAEQPGGGKQRENALRKAASETGLARDLIAELAKHIPEHPSIVSSTAAAFALMASSLTIDHIAKYLCACLLHEYEKLTPREIAGSINSLEKRRRGRGKDILRILHYLVKQNAGIILTNFLGSLDFGIARFSLYERARQIRDHWNYHKHSFYLRVPPILASNACEIAVLFVLGLKLLDKHIERQHKFKLMKVVDPVMSEFLSAYQELVKGGVRR